jgi:hypothetical protein
LSGNWRRARIALIVVALMVGTLLLSSCGGGGGEAEGTVDAGLLAQLEASSLITKEEAEAAVGEALLEPEKSSQAAIGLSISFWSAQAPTSFNYVQVSLMTTQGLPDGLRSQGYTARQNYEETRAGIGGEEVSGLGDTAFWGGSARGLHVLKGDIYFTIMISMSDDSQLLVVSKDLAAKALARLP